MVRYINTGLLVLFFQSVSMAEMTAQELLDKYAQTADKAFTSFVFKTKNTVFTDNKFTGSHPHRNLNGKTTWLELQELRSDGRRLKLIKQGWGERMTPSRMEITPESEKTYYVRLYEGEKSYQHNRSCSTSGYVAINQNDPPKDDTFGSEIGQFLLSNACLGYFKGDKERFDHTLKKAGIGRVSVRDKMEDLNGTAHYVIDAKTNRGDYAVWFNPEKGYNLSKAVVRRKSGDPYYNGKLRPGDEQLFIMDITHFRDVNGVWVPVKGKIKNDFELPKGGHKYKTVNFELTSILINPNHDALDSFSIDDIKDGARVYFADNRPGKYFWQNGKVVVDVDKAAMAELDRMAEEIMAEGKAPACTLSKAVSKKDGSSNVSLSSLSISDLLKEYRATQNKLQFFIAKGKNKIEQFDGKNNIHEREQTKSEFRYDGTRVNHRTTKLSNNPDYKSFLWDGHKLIQYQKGVVAIKNNISNIKMNDRRISKLISGEYLGASLMGYCNDSQKIDSILSKANKVSLRDKTEKINEADCYVIDAIVNGVKYEVWLDTVHGYNIARVKIRHSSNAIEFLFSMGKVEFQKIQNIWVPMEATMQHEKRTENHIRKTTWHHKRTEILLNPDHDKLKSFVADDIPDGTKVIFPGTFGDEYTWQNGKPIAEVNSNVKP